MKFDYIKCHGSGNEFVMVDAVKFDLSSINLAEFTRFICDRNNSVGADGVLLLVKRGGMFGMRMFNPDGSEAEMCGNGIRCVARLAEEYAGRREFEMFSGKNTYGIVRTEDIYPAIPTYGVDLEVRLASADFGFAKGAEQFVSQPIERLDKNLRWTAINVGNPHIVAEVEEIDYDHLTRLGKRVLELREEFPKGINVSLVKVLGANRIFVATYERGAGITASCGTAMTSSATAMALNGRCSYETTIEVENRGGAVRCICHKECGLHTQLIGNASYVSYGEVIAEGGAFAYTELGKADKEIELYNDFLKSKLR
ncbi:MAG: diaminopimelate epimerase [Alistipes sp.]|nr:diaminopimelate epimerase [Alistipes sp.]